MVDANASHQRCLAVHALSFGHVHYLPVSLRTDLAKLANAQDFSGVVAVSKDGERIVDLARGFAERANERPITVETRFGIASATKGLTALTVASLIESGELRGDTTLRSLLPDGLSMVDPEVTIEQLLGHTSGVGDYLDEEELGDIDDYVMGLPLHRLAAPADYLPLLDGHPQRTSPGSQFAYNNGGYVMLSIAVEMAAGRSFYDLVQERVVGPAGMVATAFERSDRLPAGAALGYLEDGRTNVHHLPVRGRATAARTRPSVTSRPCGRHCLRDASCPYPSSIGSWSRAARQQMGTLATASASGFDPIVRP